MANILEKRGADVEYTVVGIGWWVVGSLEDPGIPEQYHPQVRVFLEPQNLTFYGNREVVDAVS
jgi:hypothetical protein